MAPERRNISAAAKQIQEHVHLLQAHDAHKGRRAAQLSALSPHASQSDSEQDHHDHHHDRCGHQAQDECVSVAACQQACFQKIHHRRGGQEYTRCGAQKVLSRVHSATQESRRQIS